MSNRKLLIQKLRKTFDEASYVHQKISGGQNDKDHSINDDDFAKVRAKRKAKQDLNDSFRA